MGKRKKNWSLRSVNKSSGEPNEEKEVQNPKSWGTHRNQNQSHNTNNTKRLPRKRHHDRRQSSTSASTSHCDQQDSSELEIPGFYYDREKKKYFRILPGQNNAHASAVTKEIVSKKIAEDKRQQDLKHFSSGLNREAALHEQKSSQRNFCSKNICDILKGQQSGFINAKVLQSKIARSVITTLQPRAKTKWDMFSIYPGNRERVEHMIHMWPNRTGEYYVCLWSVVNSFSQVVQPIKIDSLKCTEENRKLDLRVSSSGSCSTHTLSKISDMRWALWGDTEMLLYTTTCYTGNGPSLVKLRNILPTEANEVRAGHEFNIGHRATWACAWNDWQNKVSIGTEKCCLVLDMTRRLWELSTNNSDVLSQSFSKSAWHLYSGCRSGFVYSHDLRSLSTRHVASLRHHSPVCHVCEAADDNYVLTATFNGKIQKWDRRKSQRPVLSYNGHVNEYSRIPFHVSEENKILYSAGCDNYIRIWDLVDGNLLHTIPPAYPASLETIPTVHYSNNLLGYSGLLVGTHDQIMFYTL